MLELTWRGGINAIPIDGSCLCPDGLAALSAAAIVRMPLRHGNRVACVGDFFAVNGNASDSSLHLEGDLRSVTRIGAQMAAGKIFIDGPAGMHLGAEMRGGRIECASDADEYAGAEMAGGVLRIRGNAGARAGAAYPGSPRGMSGGVLVIDGNAGDEVGAQMRRGLVAVAGSVGDMAGHHLVAGTILIFGEMGARVGLGMRRGTMVAMGAAPVLLPTFSFACEYQPDFLRLYAARLEAEHFPALTRAWEAATYRRYAGDHVEGGKGEILILKR